MKKRTQLLSALALSVGLALSASFQAVASIPGQATDQAPLPNLAPTLKKVLPAVMDVRVEGTASQGQKIPGEFREFFGDGLPDQPAQPFEGLDSSVIISASKGYVLTDNHVINQTQKISIQFNDGRESDAKLTGSDDQSDIVLLQIQNPNKLAQITTADSDKLRAGDFAIAVGSPSGFGQTATSGIVPALGRSGLNLEGLESFIQTDASINHGNSGGALLNLNGELIGIDTAILAPDGGNVGIGFATPSNMAQTLVQQSIGFGEVKRGLLGIRDTETNVDIAKAFSPGVQCDTFVSEVLPGSGSAKVGVKAGDIITSLNGKPPNSFAELCPRIATIEPGTKVKPGLLHNGEPPEIEVTLDINTSPSVSTETITPALEGAASSDGQLKDGGKDIRIDKVVKGNPAAQVDLQKDDVITDVNRGRVNSIAEIRKALAAKPAIIVLQIVRGDESIYLLIR